MKGKKGDVWIVDDHKSFPVEPVSEVVHLAKSCCYDEDEMWCSDLLVPPQQTRELDKATCRECLLAAAEYGKRAAARAAEVLKHSGSE